MLNTLRRFLATSNDGIMLDIERRLQPLLLMFSAIFVAFSVTNFVGGSVAMSTSDFTLASFIFFSNYMLQKRWLPPMFVVAFILGIVATAVISELVLSGAVSSFLYYYGVIPFFVFYIAGRYIGVVYSFFLIALIWMTWFLSQMGWFTLEYTSVEVVFFTPLYAFAAFCAWMFEVEREENRLASYEQGLRHESLLKAIGEVYYRIDSQGKIIEMSDALFDITGYKPSEVINNETLDFYADPNERKGYMQELMTKGFVENYPVTILGKNKESIRILMSSHLIYDKKDRFKYIEGMFRDITVEQRIESEKEMHLNHLQKLSYVEDLLVNTDLEHALQITVTDIREVFHANRAFLTPLCFLNDDEDNPGYQKTFDASDDTSFALEEFIGHEEVRFYLSAVPKRSKRLSQVLSDTSVFSSELRKLCALETHAMIVLHSNQDTYWLLGLHNFDDTMDEQQQTLFLDISRRIGATLNQLLLQRSLESAAHQAEVASKAKGEFVATISHELRTPLHGVIGLLDLMAQEAEQLSDEQQQNLALAQASSQVLRSLIDDVLDLSKIESGNIELHKQAFNLRQVLIDGLVPFVMKARSKGIALYLEMRDVSEVIEGDAQRLRQVLLNLVGNAIKFTMQGYVRIVVSQDDEYLLMNIEDSGIGIAREKQGDVFNPFSQVHDREVLGDNLQEKGTGLGTTISQHFIKMMGGTLTLQSEPEIGSTMSIRLPLQSVGEQKVSVNLKVDDLIQSPSLSAQKKEHENQIGNKGWRILLAEDDPVGRRVAVKRLQRQGFDIDTAADGLIAYTMIQQGNYDVLLTDIRMPGLSGLQLTEKIRSDENMQKQTRLTIVGLSAYALDDVKKEALACGMDAFITKPVDMKALSEILETHCEPNC